MRGKLTFLRGEDEQGGNIPAYAGKTVVAFTITGKRSEHPRVCGENYERR